MPYQSPVADMRFILDHVVGFGALAETEHFAEATPEIAEAILSEAARLCDEVLAPLNRSGDLSPAVLENGVVRTSPGFAEGYRAIAEGGWVAISANPEHGGMGLPVTLAMAVNDMMSGSCLALQLSPLMTQGQLDALEEHAAPEMKALYMPKLASGDWAGTMNLTEAGAGSDVGALRTKAEPAGDGTYRITGQKIFISWGDNDIVENVCHLVLARLPDAPPGTKGISLFMVPKYLPDDAGNPGTANDLKVVSLEHKLGLHGSPTCVMAFEGATGWLVGAENTGMAAMFTMMNNARLGVGVQGVGVAEAAYQQALEYALERKQGRTRREGSGTIVDHADVRRMLMTMKAEVFAARALTLDCAVSIDMARAKFGTGTAVDRAAFLTPIAKAFGTDTGASVATMGMQVHGGMGYIEETGAAQYFRDVRVTQIYEGTNGIQAMDLVARKLADGGATALALLDDVAATSTMAGKVDPQMADAVSSSVKDLRAATNWMVSQGDLDDRFAGASAYLHAFARVLGANYHLKALIAENGNGPRAILARYFITRLLPQVQSSLAEAQAGSAGVFAMDVEAMGA